MRASGMARRISPMASIPSFTGMSRSITMTSGFSASALLTASAPSTASPASAKAGSELISARRPMRTTAMVFGDQDSYLFGHQQTPEAGRSLASTRHPCPGREVTSSVPPSRSIRSWTLLRPMPSLDARTSNPLPSSITSTSTPLRRVAQGDGHRSCARVFQDVVKQLLHHPVQAFFLLLRERAR